MKKALLTVLLVSAGVQAHAHGYLKTTREVDTSSAIQGNVVSMNIVGELTDAAIRTAVDDADLECGKKVDLLNIKVDDTSAGANKEIVTVETYCRVR